MASGIDTYSTTALSNTAINGIDIAENCQPSGINNAMRQMMADIRAFANDISGKAVSSGTDTVTLTTETGWTGYVDGIMLGFIAGGTNTGAVTLNVDGVGAKAIRKGADAALVAGDITAGMPCLVMYDASANSAAGAWMLVNPLAISAAAVAAGYQPLDADLTTWAGVTPSANGQSLVAAANYAAMRALLDLEPGTDIPGLTQTDEINGLILGSLSNRSYTIALAVKRGGTITEVTTKCVSGTATATWKINSTALGGTANSVSSSEETQAHASANAVVAGDDLVLTISSNASCVDMSFTIKITRTLA
jgi:hypothetical protein